MKTENINITTNKQLDHSIFQIQPKHPQPNSKIPKIKILGTGGTIASKGTSTTQTAGYKIDLTIEELISEIPDISTHCEIEYEQIFNIDSKEMNWDYLKILYKSIVENLESFDGIVITHGTDTLEETSFFLQLVIDTDKPIVLCGSMRPSSAISCDGPMNLYQAILIACSPFSIGRGVLVALNDKIGSGFYITKSNANTLDTFKSAEGDIGNFVNNEIHYYFPATKPIGLSTFDFHLDFPNFRYNEVLIFYAYQGFNIELVRLSLQLNVKGIILATMGAGSMSDETNTTLQQISIQHNIPIVYSKRSMSGMVPKGGVNEQMVAGGYLNPQKCRILLQLCLSTGMDINCIKSVFRGVYGG